MDKTSSLGKRKQDDSFQGQMISPNLKSMPMQSQHYAESSNLNRFKVPCLMPQQSGRKVFSTNQAFISGLPVQFHDYNSHPNYIQNLHYQQQQCQPTYYYGCDTNNYYSSPSVSSPRVEEIPSPDTNFNINNPNQYIDNNNVDMSSECSTGSISEDSIVFSNMNNRKYCNYPNYNNILNNKQVIPTMNVMAVNDRQGNNSNSTYANDNSNTDKYFYDFPANCGNPYLVQQQQQLLQQQQLQQQQLQHFLQQQQLPQPQPQQQQQVIEPNCMANKNVGYTSNESSLIVSPSVVSSSVSPMIPSNLSLYKGGQSHSLAIKKSDQYSSDEAHGGPRFVDITEYLNLPQNIAAQKLNIPTSTLSKRWKAAVSSNRKWPYRVVSKLDKEITTLLYNMPKEEDENEQSHEVLVLKQKLAVLLQERQEHLKPVVILLP